LPAVVVWALERVVPALPLGADVRGVEGVVPALALAAGDAVVDVPLELPPHAVRVSVPNRQATIAAIGDTHVRFVIPRPFGPRRQACMCRSLLLLFTFVAVPFVEAIDCRRSSVGRA